MQQGRIRAIGRRMTFVLPRYHLHCHQSPLHPPRRALEGTQAPHLRPGVPFRQTMASGRSCPGSSTGRPTCFSPTSGCLSPSAPELSLSMQVWPREHRISARDTRSVWQAGQVPGLLQHTHTPRSTGSWIGLWPYLGTVCEGLFESVLQQYLQHQTTLSEHHFPPYLVYLYKSSNSCHSLHRSLRLKQRMSPAWPRRVRCRCGAVRIPWQLHPHHPPPACASIRCYAATTRANAGSDNLAEFDTSWTLKECKVKPGQHLEIKAPQQRPSRRSQDERGQHHNHQSR